MAAFLHLLAGWFGIATLIGIAAVLVAIFDGWIAAQLPVFLQKPLANLRHWAILVAIAAFSFTYVSGSFYHAGIKFEKAEWDAAKAAALKAGNDARSDAERNVDDGVRDSRDTDR